jgi:hypothetical protein
MLSLADVRATPEKKAKRTLMNMITYETVRQIALAC